MVVVVVVVVVVPTHTHTGRATHMHTAHPHAHAHNAVPRTVLGGCGVVGGALSSVGGGRPQTAPFLSPCKQFDIPSHVQSVGSAVVNIQANNGLPLTIRQTNCLCGYRRSGQPWRGESTARRIKQAPLARRRTADGGDSIAPACIWNEVTRITYWSGLGIGRVLGSDFTITFRVMFRVRQ